MCSRVMAILQSAWIWHIGDIASCKEKVRTRIYVFFLFCIVCTYVGKKIFLLGTTKIFLLGTTNIDPPCLNRAPGLNRVSEPHCLNRGALAKQGCPV